MIRPIKNSELSSIKDIYNYYIRETTVTFEESEITKEEILSRVQKVKSDGLPWLVIEENEQVIGYSHATKWKERSAYRNSVEISVYLLHTVHGRGLGSQLYEALFRELKKRDFHLAIGGITLPNAASIALHEKFGMKKVAHFKEIGFKFNKWLDVGYWQKTL
jgi:phosphinothricin acetyltransferase